MSSENLRPIIIKRKKVSGGDGHHGGAWKVAYADFVTAMMAFFMLMWLLNATTEKQRKGLADYFAPTIAISRVSGGGDGALGGDSFQSPSRLPGSSTGQLASLPPGQGGADTALSMAEETKLKQLATGLAGKGGDSLVREMAARHINAEITDEGLVILVSDLEDAPLFDPDTGAAKPVLKDVLSLLVEAFSGVDNRIAISSHTAAFAKVLQNNPAWKVTTNRAQVARDLMEAQGENAERFERLTGYGQSQPVHKNPMRFENNRLEITLLRDQPK